MLKLTKYFPNIIDLQIDPRLKEEPFGFVEYDTTSWFDCWTVQLGPFKFFWGYLKK